MAELKLSDGSISFYFQQHGPATVPGTILRGSTTPSNSTRGWEEPRSNSLRRASSKRRDGQSAAAAHQVHRPLTHYHFVVLVQHLDQAADHATVWFGA